MENYNVLSLARMFLYNADVWLLDEPTTNLDSLNTGLIIDSLSKYQDQKIIVIISHQPQVKAVCEKLIDWGKMRIIHFIIGMISFVVGTIGIVVPVLPTVPLYLLAVLCWAKSSNRFHQWFINSNLYKNMSKILRIKRELR